MFRCYGRLATQMSAEKYCNTLLLHATTLSPINVSIWYVVIAVSDNDPMACRH